MDASIIFVAMPHPSTPVHRSEQCTTCLARSQRHQRRSGGHSSGTLTIDNNDTDSSPEIAETNLEAQLALTTTNESTLLLPPPPPPPYSRRRRYQRLDVDPPTYSSVLITPPPDQPVTSIRLTIRYIETLVLEDNGYTQIVCPTARKFRTYIRVYPSMAWDRFWECLRQAKPAFTMREGGLRSVKALRRKGKWERLVLSRLAGGVSLSEQNWAEVRTAICDGGLDKIVAAV